MIVQRYAQVVGVVLVLLGVVGLLLGERSLLGVLNIDVLEDIVHVLTGGLLVYIGFARPNLDLARTLVGALGAVYLLVGVLGFIIPMLFGLLPHGYSVVDNLIHLALGVLSLAVAFGSGRDTTARV